MPGNEKAPHRGRCEASKSYDPFGNEIESRHTAARQKNQVIAEHSAVDDLSDAAWFAVNPQATIRLRDPRPGDGVSAASARWLLVGVSRTGALAFLYRPIGGAQ